MADSQPSTRWEPEARWASFSAAVRGELHVLGGRTASYSSKRDVGLVQVYHQVGEVWRGVLCSGNFPPCLYNGASTLSGHNIYVCGGDDGTSFHATLYGLDTVSYKWSQLAGHSPGGPMRKSASGLLACSNQQGNPQLLLFGGLGRPTYLLQAGAEWIKSGHKDYGCTNELHTFDLTEGKGVML